MPTNSSPARGLGTVSLNTDGTLSYKIDYIGLTADFVEGQLQLPGSPETNDPVILPLANQAYSARAGKLSGVTPALNAQQKSALTNGQVHANVLTTSFPEGEIRGQFSPAPFGPYNPEDWPATIDASKKVHYISTDNAFSSPGDDWREDELTILTGGDQVTQRLRIGGHIGVKLTGQYLNIADRSYQDWADTDTVDILMQVYGDTAWLGTNGNPRTFTFLIGTLPSTNQSFPVGGFVPIEIKNKQWNWVLFRIMNGIRPFDGARFLGSLASNAQGGTQFGGVNGGTIRMENVPGIIVRLIAFGEKGAFGEPAQINLFSSSASCDPEPPTNVVWNDINAGTNDHLEILNDTDQTVAYQDKIGPPDDQRRAVQATGTYMNFGITGNYLGKSCNDPRAMKICVEFYDDPALTGTQFGPEEYATDDKGGTDTYAMDRRHTLEGTGQWVRRSFTIPAVNLIGVRTAPLTGGPRFIFEGGTPFISRVSLGVFRVGTNLLAGLDPLPDCYEDPRICTDAYGNYAELDLAQNIRNGLDVGTSGGDQTMVVEEAGPEGDRRLAVRPDNPAGYLNFAITDNALGPSTQDNARLAICVTYFDDPALTGATFRPQAYQTDRFGQLTTGFAPLELAVTLQGSQTWREAYFEISDMKFYGANQSPQGAARFLLSAPIFITSVRYAIIRPCGPQAGVNLLESCKPVSAPLLGIAQTAATIQLFWPTNAAGFVLQTSSSLLPAQWTAITDPPTVQNGNNTVTQPIAGNRFYRLAK